MSLPSLAPNQNGVSLPPSLGVEIEVLLDNVATQKFNANCLTANFLQYIYIKAAQQSTNFPASGSPFNDNESVLDNANVLNSEYNYNGFILQPTGGMLFGKGTAPITLSDYVLPDIITNGTGTGQLSVGTQIATQGITINGNAASFILKRSATNNSGASITVSETGIYGMTSSNHYYLILHSLFSYPVIVPNLSTISILITFTINV